MFKAVVTDLDGTLLAKDHKITDFTKETIKKFIDKGYKLYIATGRIEKGAKLVSSKIDRKIPLITTNGARIIDEDSNEISSVFLDEYTNKILTEIDYEKFGGDIFLNGYQGENWFVISEKHLNKYFKDRLDKTYRPEIITKEEFKTKRYNKIYFVGTFESLLKLREELRELIGDRANIAFVSENSLEVYDKSANKANAAKLLLERDGIKPEEVLAFGDGLNDYEMLKEFENSFVMENALQELKDLLPEKEILEESSTDSVARKIIEVFNL